MSKQRLLGAIVLVAALLGLDRTALLAQNSVTGLTGLTDPGSVLTRANPQSDIISFSVVPTIDLADIQPVDILGPTPSSIDRSSTAAIGLLAALAGVDSGGTFNLSVERTFDGIWSAWVKKRSSNDLLVDLTLIGWEGTPAALVSLADPTSRIAVSVTSTPPVRIDSSGGDRLMSGGAVFGCDLSAALRSGTYQGQLVVTLSII